MEVKKQTICLALFLYWHPPKFLNVDEKVKVVDLLRE